MASLCISPKLRNDVSASLKKIDRFVEEADRIAGKFEDVVRVPEGPFIAAKIFTPIDSPSSAPVTLTANALGEARGMVSCLRSIFLGWNVLRGNAFRGGLFRIILDIVLVAARTLSFISFLHRSRWIRLPESHAQGVSYGISAGFTTVSILCFVKALADFRSSQDKDTKEARAKALYEKFYKKQVESFKMTQNKAKELIAKQIDKEIQEKGDEAFSEFLEALITPVDTGAVSHTANPYVVVPLALLGGISAGWRLWRSLPQTT